MYFADFWANFCNFFDDYFDLLRGMGIEKTPLTVSIVMNYFVVKNMTKKDEN